MILPEKFILLYRIIVRKDSLSGNIWADSIYPYKLKAVSLLEVLPATIEIAEKVVNIL